MILNMGVRTTDPMRVAYITLREEKDDVALTAQLLTDLAQRGVSLTDTTMIVTYEAEKGAWRRELLVPLNSEAEGMETRTLPPMRVTFMVYTGSEAQVEEHYRHLRRYMDEHGLKPSREIHSIEAHYAPEDLDEQDWETEIMIPLGD